MYKIYEHYDIETDTVLSDLELMVMVDMDRNGYNPYDDHDVQDYWKERLT